jgi:GAF domain-containing protein
MKISSLGHLLRRLINVVAWSLSAKILTMVLGALVLLAAVSLAIGIHSSRVALRSEVHSRFASIASGKMQSVADMLIHQLVLLRGIALDPVIVAASTSSGAQQVELTDLSVQVQNALWHNTEDSDELIQGMIDSARNPATARLWMHISQEDDILDIVVVDSVGAVVAATSRPDDYYQSLATWWRSTYNLGEGRPYVGMGVDPVIGSYLEVAVPIMIRTDGPETDAGLHFAGAVRARFDVNALVNALKATPLVPGQGALITDAQGDILAITAPWAIADGSRVPESWIGREYNLAQYRRTHEARRADGTPVLLGHSGIRQLDIPGHNAAAVLDKLDWILFVYQPTREAYAALGRVEMQSVGVGVALLVLAVGCYVWSQSAVMPVEQLTAFARTHVVPWIEKTDLPTSQGEEAGLAPPLTLEVLQAGHGAERAWIYPQPEAEVLAQAINRLLDEQASLLNTLRMRDATEERERQRRQRDVTLTTSIGDVVSVASDVESLTQRVVGLIRDHYNLYFVGFYLANTATASPLPDPPTPSAMGAPTPSGMGRRWAVLYAGTGEAGRTLVARGHRVAIQSSTSSAEQAELVGVCLATGRVQLARDLGAGRHRSDSDVLPYARSEIVVPLRSRAMVLGAITALSYQSDTFDEAAIQVLQMIADRLAIAIDSIRLYTDSRLAAERLQRAYGELSREAWRESVGQRVGRGYEALATGVRPLTPLAPDRWPSEVRAAWRGTESRDGGASGAAEAGASEAFRLALPIRIRGGAGSSESGGGASAASDVAPSDGASDVASSDAASDVASSDAASDVASSDAASDVIGVLEVSKAWGDGDWTPGEMDQLRALATQLGQALENARLYEMTQQNALEEQMVGDITRRLRETLSVDTVLQSAVRELRGLLRPNEVEVRLGGAWMETESDPLAGSPPAPDPIRRAGDGELRRGGG